MSLKLIVNDLEAPDFLESEVIVDRFRKTIERVLHPHALKSLKKP